MFALNSVCHRIESFTIVNVHLVKAKECMCKLKEKHCLRCTAMFKSQRLKFQSESHDVRRMDIQQRQLSSQVRFGGDHSQAVMVVHGCTKSSPSVPSLCTSASAPASISLAVPLEHKNTST